MEFEYAAENNNSDYLKKVDLMFAGGETFDIAAQPGINEHFEMDAAGLPVPKPDWTWDDYREYARKLTKGEGVDKVYGSHKHTWQICNLLGMYSTKLGNPYFKGAADKLNFGDPNIRGFLQFRYDLENVDKTEMPYFETKSQNVPYRNQWFNQKAAMMPKGICYRPGAVFRIQQDKGRYQGGRKGCRRYRSAEDRGTRIEQKVVLRKGSCSVEFDARPELWCPENPKLYTVSLAYGSDKIFEKIGFREIKVIGTEILLNGSRIFLKGISAHEESVQNGKAVTEDEIRENFRLAKEMNCNYMRLAHYPHTEKASRLADEMGLMLWEEILVYWAIEFKNEDTYWDAENQLSELIKRDINRSSVIIWSVGNENPDTEDRLAFMSSLVRKAKQLDPTRLVSAACILDHKNHVINDRLSNYLDIIGANQYYGWYMTDFNNLIRLFENSKPDKPVVATEFGADAKPGHRGTIDEKGTEDYQLELYKKQVDVLSRILYIKGISPWILFDFRCPRRLHFTQDYYNTKGLLSADKKHKKPAFFVMKDFYSNCIIFQKNHERNNCRTGLQRYPQFDRACVKQPVVHHCIVHFFLFYNSVIFSQEHHAPFEKADKSDAEYGFDTAKRWV